MVLLCEWWAMRNLTGPIALPRHEGGIVAIAYREGQT